MKISEENGFSVMSASGMRHNFMENIFAFVSANFVEISPFLRRRLGEFDFPTFSHTPEAERLVYDNYYQLASFRLLNRCWNFIGDWHSRLTLIEGEVPPKIPLENSPLGLSTIIHRLSSWSAGEFSRQKSKVSRAEWHPERHESAEDVTVAKTSLRFISVSVFCDVLALIMRFAKLRAAKKWVAEACFEGRSDKFKDFYEL